MMRSGLAVVALCIGMAQPAAAQSIGQIALTPPEMRVTAITALRDGQSARALALSEALLLRDPTDLVALRVGARAALNIGQSDVALERARSLFQLSTNDDERYFAARLAALAAAQQDRFTASQYWLRRARQLAPNDAEAASVAADYRAVTNRNPLAFRVDFGFSPSSNINDGTSEDTFDIEFFGTSFTLPFPPEQQELSGYEYSASGAVTYVLSQSSQALTQVRAGLSTRQYRLSSDSKAAAPNFDVDALNSWRLSSGIQHFWNGSTPDRLSAVSLDYGYTTRGGDPFATDLQAGYVHQWRLTDGMTLTGSATAGRVDYRLSDESANIWTGGLAWANTFENDTTLTLSASVGRSQSYSARLDYTFQSLGVTYDLAPVADQFDIDISAGYDWRTYGSRSADTVTRSNETAEVALSVGFSELEIYGFTPVLNLQASRTNSTAARSQTEELALDLNFRSSF